MAESGIDIVRRTAALANLEITDEEAARLGPQFARILEAFRTLEGLDVEGVEAVLRGGEPLPVVRADEVRPSLPPDAALANAPAREDGFYSVPKTLGGDA